MASLRPRRLTHQLLATLQIVFAAYNALTLSRQIVQDWLKFAKKSDRRNPDRCQGGRFLLALSAMVSIMEGSRELLVDESEQAPTN